MKVGNLVNGLEVIDVKRVNKMNLMQFTKAVSEYIDQGYKIDVNSSRQIGLVLQVDCYKLESNVGESVGSTEVKEELESKQPNVKTVEALQEATELLDEAEPLVDKIISNAHVAESLKSDEERKDDLEKSVEEAKQALNTFTTPEQNDVAVQKKTRTKKTT